ncbi:MAG: prephenate dehydrogenase [Treponema sp.]|nr:prephenate dehydrogenase [Treponema sp.]
MRRLDELTYGIVGLGIMGGSFAKSIRQNILSRSSSSGKIYACNRSTACLNLAMQEGITDKTFTSDQVEQMLCECDIVFVCLYPHATVDFLKQHRESFKSGSIITDISGVKGIFIDEGDSLVRDDVDFIIGHPMAGGEKEGYAASNAKYFINHNYILCPRKENKTENVLLFKNLIGEMGFSRITETSCDTHDWKIGFTSQLCHVIASALVQSADGPDITAFGGGSFEDLTRIAMINAPLWTELFISNKEKLVEHIENFENALSVLKKDIATSNGEGLKSYLEEVRAKRIAMACNHTSVQ